MWAARTGRAGWDGEVDVVAKPMQCCRRRLRVEEKRGKTRTSLPFESSRSRCTLFKTPPRADGADMRREADRDVLKRYVVSAVCLRAPPLCIPRLLRVSLSLGPIEGLLVTKRTHNINPSSRHKCLILENSPCVRTCRLVKLRRSESDSLGASTACMATYT